MSLSAVSVRFSGLVAAFARCDSLAADLADAVCDSFSDSDPDAALARCDSLRASLDSARAFALALASVPLGASI
jgi:hypothetical protein